MLHAYRLTYPDSPHAPEMLWEWERPSIDRLLWNAKTFRHAVVQCYFADWNALAEENHRIWKTCYAPRPAYESWDTWSAWLDAYREIVRDVQDIYDAHDDRRDNDPKQARQTMQQG